MAMIEIRIWVEASSDGHVPDVRAFVDLEPERGLGAECALPLEKRANHEWVGAFAIAGDASHFLYRVGIAAEEGADWSLIVRDRGLALDLFSDADSLAASKNWFVGSCLLAPARAASPRNDARSARPRLAPHASLPSSVLDGTVVYLDHYRAAR